jgi:hypothetical protein
MKLVNLYEFEDENIKVEININGFHSIKVKSGDPTKIHKSMENFILVQDYLNNMDLEEIYKEAAMRNDGKDKNENI